MSATGGIHLALRGRGTRPFESKSRLLVSAGGVGQPVETPVDEVQVGDWVGVTYGGEWPPAPALVPQPSYGPIRGSEKAITIPPRMTEDLAFLLGAYLAEGHTTRSNWSVILTNSVVSVLEKAQTAWRDVFGLESRITREPGRCTGLVVSSKRLVEFMDGLAIGSRAANKAVPHCILDGSREHALAFLQGAALDAYTTTSTASKWAICLESSKAIDGLQDMMTKLGVTNAQIPKFNRQMNKTYYELYAPGRAGQELCRLVPFLEPDKENRARAYVAATLGGGTADVIPGVIGRELYDMVPRGKGGRNGGRGRQKLRHLRDPRTARVCRSSVKRAREAGATLPDWLDRLLESTVRFSPVVDVLRWGEPRWTRRPGGVGRGHTAFRPE